MDRALVLDWFEKIRNHIAEKAATQFAKPRDFASTLLGCVVGPTVAAYFHIGDGAIVARRNGVMAPVFWPDSGEYENTTNFVTDADAVENLRINIVSAIPDDVAMFTDGLQRLALSFQSMSAHEPFFEEMFNTVRRSRKEDCDVLSEQLAQYLRSDKVNERTDDDKTLVLGCKVDTGNQSE
jgi:hypothetical protein